MPIIQRFKNHELHAAIINGDFHKVKQLITQSPEEVEAMLVYATWVVNQMILNATPATNRSDTPPTWYKEPPLNTLEEIQKILPNHKPNFG